MGLWASTRQWLSDCTNILEFYMGLPQHIENMSEMSTVIIIATALAFIISGSTFEANIL